MTNTKLMQMPVVTELEKLTPSMLVNAPFTEQKFVQLFNKVHGVESGGAAYEVEKFHFMKQLQENKALAVCTKLSLYGAFLDVAVQGLSFDPTRKLAYLVPYNYNAGTQENPKWEKRANLQISPYGELAIRQQLGQIKFADNPVIVYEGDVFEPGFENGKKTVTYKMKVPRGTKIIGSFIHIVKLDGTDDFFWMVEQDIARLKGYSERKNNGKANALYTSSGGEIDPGFLAAKTIKHAFKSYPKVKLRGNFSKIEPDEPEVTEDAPIDYGITGVPTDQEPPAAPDQEPNATAYEDVPTSAEALAITAAMRQPEKKENEKGVTHSDESIF